MMRHSWILLALPLLVSSCEKSSFSGGNGANAMPKSQITIPGTKDTTVDSPFTVKNGQVDILFEAGALDKMEGEKVKKPFTLYFVLDVSGSMQPVLDAIKDNIKEFASVVKGKGFDLNLGAIAFIDDVTDTFNPTTDVDAFAQFIDTQVATGGGDMPEAGLIALRQTLGDIKSNADADDIQVILVITDALSHQTAGDGNEGTFRDCELDATIADFKALGSSIIPRTKLYYAAGQFLMGPCGGFKTAKEQYDAMFDKVLTSTPKANRGGFLGYPFDKSTLMGRLVKELESTTVGDGLVCLPSQATVLHEGDTVTSWKPKSYAEVYDAYKNDRPLTWEEAFDFKKLKEYEGKKMQFVVDRCCHEKDKAATGGFDGCYKEITQKVTFDLKIKK
jgi:hypothetical protein